MLNDDSVTTRNAQQADALLGQIHRQRAGRLTVFLGAAPGVGKTYAMLTRARDLLMQGTDVLVGIVETHGRSETQALADGLPVVARRQLSYQGRMLPEMDLDAILARKPAIALVDELAHRNAPGSRHERRWQDVDELLDAGIDVYTTMNIQHLESLNDVVHQITGIRVSETVPDAVFERLKDIRLVDLPARELIERLNQGKVYLPEQATLALDAFFSPSNLTALRELAMQTVAEHVNVDLRQTRTAKGLLNLTTQHHVLVAIDGKGQSEFLVRAGCRIAERRGASWSVVTVAAGGFPGLQSGHATDFAHPSRPTTIRHEQERQLELDKAFSLARNLGARTEVLHGSDIAQTLLDAAATRGARAIVLGRTRERPIARIFNRTLTQQLLQRGANYELTIIGAPEARKTPRMLLHSFGRVTRIEIVSGLTATIGATIAAFFAKRWFGLEDLSMIFLVAVVLVASRTRMSTAAVTALLCFLSYDYFFIAPSFTLLIQANQGIVTILMFLAAALIAGRLASRLRMQVVALSAANTHAIAMQDLGRLLSKAADLGQIIAAGSSFMQSALRAHVWIRINGVSGPLAAVDDWHEKDQFAADWTQKYAQPSGRFTDTLTQSDWWFLPIHSDHDTLGVVALRFPAAMTRLSFEQRRLAESLADDIGQAASRARLVSDLEAARLTGETEQLRSALLSSISHDLRSPLSSMIGSADSLARYGDAMSEPDRQSLLETIRLEGERLDRYIQNLLDMTRLGQQGLTLARDWIGIDELIGSAVRRLTRYLPHIEIRTHIPPDVPLVHVHPALLEQAFFNVLENAAKFSPPGRYISVLVSACDDHRLQVDISDEGPGITEENRKKVFDMFFTMQRGDRKQSGTGLGLTIVQAIVGAHMGSVQAMGGPNGAGTTIRITLPLDEAQENTRDES